MLKKILNHKGRSLLVILLVLALAAVRMFEDLLFYDPFLDFFKGEFANQPLPEFNVLYLSLGLFFRYLLNTAISLGIIYVIFKEKELLKFAAFLYIIFFIILMLAFFGIIYFSKDNCLTLFYVRRFIIQPLFVILFVPAFYYQEQMAKK